MWSLMILASENRLLKQLPRNIAIGSKTQMDRTWIATLSETQKKPLVLVCSTSAEMAETRALPAT
jgi:hypothetical protein